MGTMSGNTKNDITLRFFIYYDKRDKEFVGVCIDLGIIKTGNDPSRVKIDLENAAIGYVEAVEKADLPEYLLNQKPPKQYLEIFENIILALKQRPFRQPKHNVSEAQAFSRSVRELCPVV
ncbi:MAG: hypothetical protein A3B31_02105 [Candidatus Komeilibacteria bacterium RIFCSPLOWO2_01_FULL_53_11]|uniref:Uncharacterized protein n=1 Tax=Candidatus Komeilibacteria bacterium RIFCSPLOWO2_01_FULL_53_11 TaxID=1798552 RepID=A0A1G2BRJ8_9BACT|nr:MAG: hypothetical protein A3B31_02105 [Candidatus Komeilibacteria bacterium RIFCSPLOWO2_01_FULL_53_11]